MTEAIGWKLREDKAEIIKPDLIMSSEVFDGFTHDEGQVLALLKKSGTLQLDDISWQSGMHLNKLAALLLNLEFQGMIRSMPGKKYGLI